MSKSENFRLGFGACYVTPAMRMLFICMRVSFEPECMSENDNISETTEAKETKERRLDTGETETDMYMHTCISVHTDKRTSTINDLRNERTQITLVHVEGFPVYAKRWQVRTAFLIDARDRGLPQLAPVGSSS